MRAGLIGAMDNEVDLLRASIQDLTEETVAGYKFYRGTLSGTDTVLLRSGIGKVNAAIGTTLLIDRFKPDFILNTGSAGGISPFLNVGDVVISNEIRHHDVDATIFGYVYGQVPSMPVAHIPNPVLFDAALRSANRIPQINARTGMIVTGDSFMNDPHRVQKVIDNFPGVSAVEMEAASIAQTCYQFELPFLIIRSLSDIAGKESKQTYETYIETAARNSATLIIEILKELESEWKK